MLKKIMNIGAAIAMGAATLVPAAPAMARDHHRHYSRGDHYRGYDRGHYYRGDRYDRRAYYRDDRHYYRGNNYRYRRHCSDGATGTILGAVAGGLLGNSVVGRYGDQTAGTIIGGAAGAIAGRAIDKGSDRC